ncbi:NUDIX domain-containing protein [Haloarchaeobius sp. HME9146]|uniref:NUDIX domain-containing protein n=1 Tax=Haloarchaeobius sp. HME9146 TaxID=2978732 RepID=UPI0021C1CC6B|nr:NUDIX domain-containing protein [Haloarchaeobius sp. HME9146]MCT9095992.1 NUDIX domain-containing protein [Haloarchaeobius sp. HME9146]
MPPARYNANEVARRVGRLTDEYDDVTVVTEREEPQDQFDELRQHAEEGYLGGAYCWTVRSGSGSDGRDRQQNEDCEDARKERKRVLLGMGCERDSWCPPGGGVDGYDPAQPGSGERFEETARRTVREETGIECEPTECVFVHWAVVGDPNSDDEVHLAYVVFDAEYRDGSVAIEPEQLNGAAWFAELPPNLHYFAQRRADQWPV